MGETRVVKIEPTENPNYFAIIPANVRYSDITPNAKLLFAEISALTNKEGYCWATNAHFAGLYSVSERIISKWIKELKDNKFIDFKPSNGFIRKIYLSTGQTGVEQNIVGGRTKVLGGTNKSSRGVEQKFIHNNKYNIKDNNKKNTVLYAPAEDPKRTPMIVAKDFIKEVRRRSASWDVL